jgi:hypothetical protein
VVDAIDVLVGIVDNVETDTEVTIVMTSCVLWISVDNVVLGIGGGGGNEVGSGTREDGAEVAIGVAVAKLVATDVISTNEVDCGIADGGGGGIVSWRATKDGLETDAHSSLIVQLATSNREPEKALLAISALVKGRYMMGV